MMPTEKQKKRISLWFSTLQERICKAFEQMEIDLINPQTVHKKPGKFKTKNWNREDNNGGGGKMAIMEGRLFEKVGVNVSTVYGNFSEEFRAQIPGASEDPSFWASGLSLVAHMASPHVPAVHMNTRHIITTKSWFGGGADLTPIFPKDKETKSFHNSLKKCCDTYNVLYYNQFKKQADDYFFLPHRNEHRGIGGIFYDYLNSGNWEEDFSFTQDIGKTFLDIYSSIIKKKHSHPWTEKERATQLEKRGRYVEFNLLYDRGTKFGFKTGGNTDAILMSLPPAATWPSPI